MTQDRGVLACVSKTPITNFNNIYHLIGDIPNVPEDQGPSRDKQGQPVIKQGQSRDKQDLHIDKQGPYREWQGQNKDKQGQLGVTGLT